MHTTLMHSLVLCQYVSAISRLPLQEKLGDMSAIHVERCSPTIVRWERWALVGPGIAYSSMASRAGTERMTGHTLCCGYLSLEGGCKCS